MNSAAMESTGISAPPFLPDEIIILILSKATLKSLHRLKWVSKSWFSLITNEVLVNSPYLSFYYADYKSSKSLDFLPNDNSGRLIKLSIFDSCGGLVLCTNQLSIETSCYVCNPVDKSYNQVISIGHFTDCFMLDFNPLISPHYKVIVVRRTNSCRDLEFAVFHSKKRCFEKVHVSHQHVSSIIPERRYIALWNGNVYLHYSFPDYSSKGPRPRILYDIRIMMISGVLGGSKENIICKFISFPNQSKVYTWMFNSYLGTWRDRLRFVSFDDNEIRVWVLRDSQEDEWTLEHTCACSFGSIGHSPDDKLPQIAGLHPLQNAALFIFKNSLFAYDLDQMLFEKICEIGDDAFLFPRSLVFPFSPCFAKEVLV